MTVSEAVSFQDLQFSTSGYVLTATGGGTLSPTGSAQVLVDSGVTGTISAPITGAGGLQVFGTGTLILSGASNTYSGTTTIGDGSDPSTLKGGATNAFSANSAVQVSAASTLDLGGFGQTIFSLADGTSGGGMVTNSGGTNAVLTIGGGVATAFSGAITDGTKTTGLTLTGAGTGLTLSGTANTYSGATTINSGATLALAGTGSIAASSQVAMATGGTFDISQTTAGASIKTLADTAPGQAGKVALGGQTLTITNGSTTFSGAIADGGIGGGTGGGLNIAGGTQTLAGTNTYSGGTSISAGTLAVNGSIASSSMTTVNAGATLTGTGTVGNTTIASGGALAPGNSTPGSLMTVNGSLAFQSGALYMVQLNPTTASFANVTGTSTLAGTTLSVFANGTYVSRRYTILSSAGGVSGTFNSLINTNLPSGFNATLNYDPTHAYLDLALNFTGPSFGAGLNGNQQNVGNALTNFFNSTGSIPAVFGALTPAGLTQASGELATGTQQTTFQAMTQFLGVLLDPFIGGRGDMTATTSGHSQFADGMITKAVPRNELYEPRWSVWAAGFGGSETTNGNAIAGSNSATSRIYGIAVGADYLLSSRTIAGFSLAGGGTNFSVANGGTGHSDLFQAGAFMRHTVGAAYLTGALAYGWQDVTTNRTMTVAGIDQLQARFNANAFSGRLEGGYRFVTPWMGITPYAAGQFTTYDPPAYAEQVLSGANTFALNYAAKSVTASRSELGLRTDNSYALTTAILTLRSRFAWAHNFNTDASIAPTFQALPGASFVVNGAAQAREAALTTLSAELKWRNGFSLAGVFEGEFSSTTTSYAGKGVVRYQW